jgi:hypothetical protein
MMQVFFPAATFDCTDASANVWSSGDGGSPRAAFLARARQHHSTDRLDAIAP